MLLRFSSVFQINLRLILVSGKTKEFLFSPNDSAADIAKHVYDNWPMGKPSPFHAFAAARELWQPVRGAADLTAVVSSRSQPPEWETR